MDAANRRSLDTTTQAKLAHQYLVIFLPRDLINQHTTVMAKVPRWLHSQIASSLVSSTREQPSVDHPPYPSSKGWYQWEHWVLVLFTAAYSENFIELQSTNVHNYLIVLTGFLTKFSHTGCSRPVSAAVCMSAKWTPNTMLPRLLYVSPCWLM